MCSFSFEECLNGITDFGFVLKPGLFLPVVHSVSLARPTESDSFKILGLSFSSTQSLRLSIYEG